MNDKNKNMQPMIEMPESMKRLPAETATAEDIELITIPEHLKAPITEETTRELGDVALVAGKGGRFNNGTIELSPDQIGPQAIRQNGVRIAPDTYVIPTMHAEREQ